MAKDSTRVKYKSFKFSETFLKMIRALPEKDQLRYYNGIVEYGINGIEPEWEGVAAAAWVFIRSEIDASRERRGRRRTVKEDGENGKNEG